MGIRSSETLKVASAALLAAAGIRATPEAADQAVLADASKPE